MKFDAIDRFVKNSQIICDGEAHIIRQDDDGFVVWQIQKEGLKNSILVVANYNSPTEKFNIEENGNVNLSKEDTKMVVNAFHQFYSNYLGRELQLGEKSTLTTAFHIMIWRIQGRTFSTICHSRYAFLSREKERARLDRHGQSTDHILARFTQKYVELPNNNLSSPVSLFPKGLKAKDVDYDIITYDTYDYLDKLIGLYLSDIFYAAFIKYNERCPDDRAVKMADLIKYGTYNTKYIWMLRYGMSFEDIELLDKYIESIDERGIIVTQDFANLPPKAKECIDRFIE